MSEVDCVIVAQNLGPSDDYREGGRRSGIHVRGKYVGGEVQTMSEAKVLLCQRIQACVPSLLGDAWNIGGQRVPHAINKEGGVNKAVHVGLKSRSDGSEVEDAEARMSVRRRANKLVLGDAV